MGFYQGLYFGVYMVVKPSFSETTEEEYRHPKTKKKMDTRFDPQTGVEGILTKVPKKIRKYPYPEIAKEHGFKEDVFTIVEFDGNAKNDTKCFLLNKYNDFHFKLPDPKEAFQLDWKEHFQGWVPEKLIKDFKEQYKDYIAVYEKEYGGIEYKFGFINYYH